jgi:hypothetical protein
MWEKLFFTFLAVWALIFFYGIAEIIYWPQIYLRWQIFFIWIIIGFIGIIIKIWKK